MTVENCYCLLNPTTISRENVYVAASRAKDRTTLYTAGINAGELVMKASKSRIKKMAHDLVPEEKQRLHVMEHARS